jgi:hypothetical protein
MPHGAHLKKFPEINQRAADFLSKDLEAYYGSKPGGTMGWIIRRLLLIGGGSALLTALAVAQRPATQPAAVSAYFLSSEIDLARTDLDGRDFKLLTHSRTSADMAVRQFSTSADGTRIVGYLYPRSFPSADVAHFGIYDPSGELKQRIDLPEAARGMVFGPPTLLPGGSTVGFVSAVPLLRWNATSIS